MIAYRSVIVRMAALIVRCECGEHSDPGEIDDTLAPQRWGIVWRCAACGQLLRVDIVSTP